jgi:hypothetical protein
MDTRCLSVGGASKATGMDSCELCSSDNHVVGVPSPSRGWRYSLLMVFNLNLPIPVIQTYYFSWCPIWTFLLTVLTCSFLTLPSRVLFVIAFPLTRLLSPLRSGSYRGDSPPFAALNPPSSELQDLLSNTQI